MIIKPVFNTAAQDTDVSNSDVSDSFSASDSSISGPNASIDSVNDSRDFNNDGFGDVLVQNASGQILYANMAGGNFNNWVGVANTPGYTVVGAGKIEGANADADI